MGMLHLRIAKGILPCSLFLLAGSMHAQAAPAAPAAPAAHAPRPKTIDNVPADYTGEVAMITYFKAKPGMLQVYSDWMATKAKAVDDWAAAHGAFISVVTYANPDTSPDVAWTHMRVFTFKSREQMKEMGHVLDAAHKAVYPDEAEREKAIGHKEYMRDSVGTAMLTQVIK